MELPFGFFLKLNISGAPHAPEMTFRLENFPALFPVDRAALAVFMERRAPHPNFVMPDNRLEMSQYFLLNRIDKIIRYRMRVN